MIVIVFLGMLAVFIIPWVISGGPARLRAYRAQNSGGGTRMARRYGRRFGR